MTVEPTITAGGIAILGILVTIVVGLVAVLMQNRAVRRDMEADVRRVVKEAVQPLGDRLLKVETRTDSFVPRAEIDERFKHEKGSRLQVGSDVIRLREEHADVRERQARVEQRMDGFSDTMAEIKACQREMNGKLDKLIERQGAHQ